jgi:hypothetical protein
MREAHGFTLAASTAAGTATPSPLPTQSTVAAEPPIASAISSIVQAVVKVAQGRMARLPNACQMVWRESSSTPFAKARA